MSRVNWRKWALSAMTIALVVLLASHPELRLLIPLVDAVGIDLFAVLMAAQGWGYLKPVLIKLYGAVIAPILRRLSTPGIYFFVFGVHGPWAEAYTQARFPSRSLLCR